MDFIMIDIIGYGAVDYFNASVFKIANPQGAAVYGITSKAVAMFASEIIFKSIALYFSHHEEFYKKHSSQLLVHSTLTCAAGFVVGVSCVVFAGVSLTKIVNRTIQVKQALKLEGLFFVESLILRAILK